MQLRCRARRRHRSAAGMERGRTAVRAELRPTTRLRTRGKTPGTLISLTCLDESVQRILSNVRLQTAFRWLSGIHKRNLEPMTAISPSVAGRPGATLAYAQGSSRP